MNQDYSFDKFSDFFEYYLKRHTLNSNGQKILSLQSLARRLGYSSPSLLSMIAKGKRLPTPEILEALFEEWNVDYALREIIRTKIEIERRQKKDKPVKNLILKLAKLDRQQTFRLINLEQFNAVSEWHHLVLQQLITTPSFKEDTEWISLRLRKKISPAKLKKGIETLLSTRLIQRDESSHKLLRTHHTEETSHDIPSEAIREHHRGMLCRALEALDEQSVDERHFNSLTLKFNKQKKGEAKAAILNFVRQFNETYYQEESEDIFQLNVQLFEHTTSAIPREKLQ